MPAGILTVPFASNFARAGALRYIVGIVRQNSNQGELNFLWLPAKQRKR